MDEGRATLMQMQIRRNAEDLQSYLKDLDSWENDIKQKDQGLTRHKPILKEQLPPVRSHQSATSHKDKMKNRKKKIDRVKNLGTKRITSYDYNAWDKFDVDLACEEVDYEVCSSSSLESLDEDEEGEEEKRKLQAISEKEKGNKLFKQQELELAVECYGRAMELDPTSAIMPANRAMALLKMSRYAAAEADCSLALDLDNGYVKAYLRRAIARLKLASYQAARQDFESVLKLEPANKVARTELEKLDKELGASGLRYIRAVRRPPHLRSKKPLKRIPIEDVQSIQPMPASSEASALQTLINSSSASATTCATNTSFSTTSSSTPSTPQIKLIEEIDRSSGVSSLSSRPDEAAMDQNFTGFSDVSGSSTPTKNEKILQENAGGVVKHENVAVPEENGKKKQPQKLLQLQVESTEEGRSEAGKGDVGMPPVAQSSIQFQADWKALKPDRMKLADYFKAIPICKYSTLLQHSLETGIFMDITSILHEEYIKCGLTCLEELSGLANVKRFSVAVLFLTRQQKQAKPVFNIEWLPARNNKQSCFWSINFRRKMESRQNHVLSTITTLGLYILFEDLLGLVSSEESNNVSELAKKFDISIQ